MQKFLHMAPLVTHPWAAPNKTETQKEWKKEKRSFGYLDGSSSSCPTNKRIYYHADNVNLLLHKFSAKYFCFDDKEPGQKTEKCQQQQPKRVPHALEIEHGKEKKNHRLTDDTYNNVPVDPYTKANLFCNSFLKHNHLRPFFPFSKASIVETPGLLLLFLVCVSFYCNVSASKTYFQLVIMCRWVSLAAPMLLQQQQQKKPNCRDLSTKSNALIFSFKSSL